jgi:ABC-2 type transport system permease protein
MERLAAEPLRDMNPPDSFVDGMVGSLREIWRRRELLNLLVRREIRARYKDSMLGLVWSLIRPLVQLFIYYLVIGRFLGAARNIPDFAIFVYTGLAIWSLFNEIVQMGTGSIVANGGIIKKIHLPREIFPLATVGSALFNFVIQLIILIPAALIIRGINIHTNLAAPLLGVGVAVVWAAAFALILSAVNVYLRDVQYLVEVVLMIGFWLCPIVYSTANVSAVVSPALLEVYMANPVTLAVLGMQRVIWLGGVDYAWPDHLMMRLGVAFVVGLVALLVAQRVFDRLQRNFAQEI